jgi:electron transport complex protein RnfB
LSFSSEEGAFDRYPLGRVITKEEALQVVAKAEEEGLVHHTYNVKSDHHFICNCCSCCCGIIRGMKEFHAPYMIAKSNYVAMIDQDSCEACGVCADERCPVEAIEEVDGTYAVKPERCIGCGVCTTGCPTESISLIRKPESSWDEPPSNLIEWYMKRSASRGIPMALD